jgi:phosphopantothenoylcysteine decarboxylase/phosphopantothenate--cysteine ligase
MHSRKTTRRLNFLITAGGTREYIDPVRFISNASSGKMGYELARVAQSIGHNVILISASTNQPPPKGINVIKAVSAGEMFKAVKNRFSKCDCLIMTAAVSDYTPVKTSRLKIRKSNRLITLKLKLTPDILKWAGSRKREGQLVIGFALDDRNLKAGAERKLKDKNLDIIAANRPEAIGADKSTVWMKPARGNWTSITNKSKSMIAHAVIRMVQAAFLGSSPE